MPVMFHCLLFRGSAMVLRYAQAPRALRAVICAYALWRAAAARTTRDAMLDYAHAGYAVAARECAITPCSRALPPLFFLRCAPLLCRDAAPRIYAYAFAYLLLPRSRHHQHQLFRLMPNTAEGRSGHARAATCHFRRCR